MSATTDEGPKDANINLTPLTWIQRRSWKKAIEHFHKKEYEEASSVFGEILSNRVMDFRISHNLVISRFYQNQLKDWDRFREEFLSVLKDSNINVETITVKNTSESVFLYNLAITYFQDRQPWKALELAIKLSKQPELEDYSSPLGKRIQLLIVELYVTVQNFEPALRQIEISMTQKLKNLCGGSSVSGISSCTNITDSSVLNDIEQRYEQAMQIKMQEYKTLALLGSHSLVHGWKEYQNLSKMLSTDLENAPGQIILEFLHAYYNYLRGNILNGLEIIKGIRNTNSFFFETGDLLSMMLNNNAGCCQYCLGKPTLAAWSFQKASEESNKAEYKDQKALPLHCLNFNKKYEIMYNFGVSLLHAKQSQQAFNILTLCQGAFICNPRLWLRIAECCVQLYQTSIDGSFSWTEEKRNILRGIQSEVPLRKLECLSELPIDREKPKPTLLYALHCIETALPLISHEAVQKSQINMKPSNPITNPADIVRLRADILCLGAFIALSIGRFTLTMQLCRELLEIADMPNIYEYLGKLYLGQAFFRLANVSESLNIFSNKFMTNYHLTQTTSDRTSGSYRSTRGEIVPTGGGNIAKLKIELNSADFPRFRATSEDSILYDELTARATVVYNRAVVLTSLNSFQDAIAVVDDWTSAMNRISQPLSADFTILNIYLNIKLGNLEKSSRLFRQHCPLPMSN